MKNVAGSLANYSAAAILFTFGLVYLFKDSFMPYHSEAISLKWEEVGTSTQYLILALMRAIAGGYISLAFTICFLQYKLSVNKVSWIPILILIIGTISGICTVYAEFIVSDHTPGKPPIVAAVTGELLLIIGFLFNRKYLLRSY
jgi:hypothetical protein